MNVRKFRFGEEKELYKIFYSSIHENAVGFYTNEQLEAWAPKEVDESKWEELIRTINPYVVFSKEDEEILAYGDLQENGYIDHFFVKGGKTKKGIGSILMNKIFEEAHQKGLIELTSDVSLAAQEFFKRFDFELIKVQSVSIRSCILENAKMSKIF